MSPKKEIGDPLEQVAATGRIGGARPAPRNPAPQTSRLPEVQQSSNLNVQTTELPDTQKFKGPAPQTTELSAVRQSSTSKSRSDRVQRTIYLPPALAKWLKVQAAEEEREMSEIVAEALEEYRRTH
jgi:hypothetical protein